MQTNLRFLYRNLDMNGYESVEVFPIGLSGTPGLQKMYGAGPTSSLLRHWNGSSAGRQQRYTIIATNTLDHVIGSRFDGIPVIIKMDVEGHEWEVLRGSKRTLLMTPRPVGLIEIQVVAFLSGQRNPEYFNTFNTFWEHGYRCFVANAEKTPVTQEGCQALEGGGENRPR